MSGQFHSCRRTDVFKTVRFLDVLARTEFLGLKHKLCLGVTTAEDGFPVSERISASWKRSGAGLSQDREARRVYLPAPTVSEIHRQTDLARTFRTVAEGGAHAFYHGALAERIAACVQSRGGYLTPDDLANHTTTWEMPIRTTYRDVEVRFLADRVAPHRYGDYPLFGAGADGLFHAPDCVVHAGCQAVFI